MVFDVVVVGSLNHDLSVLAPRHPRPGETVIGTGHFSGAGGKGANQAVAAARLGARVAMVGRVGDDPQGHSLIAGLAGAGVDVTGIGLDAHNPSGLAVITIDDRAENTIVVSPGANMTLAPDQVSRHSGMISAAKVVLAQLEVPVEAVLAASRISRGLFILNPAPARILPTELMDRVDLLVPNRIELTTLVGDEEPQTSHGVAEAAMRLSHPGATVVTLGGEGAMVVDEDEIDLIPSPDVTPVDPTGAGDAFCGALATALSRGRTLLDAVREATVAGALATTRRGAQPAMPTREEVESLLRV